MRLKSYVESMPTRFRHALRFALPTLVAVYLLGAAWNAVDVFLLGDADPALGARRTFWFDEQQWRIIAIVLGSVVFLWKLSDIVKTPPSWRYAMLFSLWLAAATVGTAIAMMQREGLIAAAIVTVAVVLWFVGRSRVPGRPEGSRARLSGEQELR
jgi:hypothetical protein